jgi:hypothetical protein
LQQNEKYIEELNFIEILLLFTDNVLGEELYFLEKDLTRQAMVSTLTLYTNISTIM